MFISIWIFFLSEDFALRILPVSVHCFPEDKKIVLYNILLICLEKLTRWNSLRNLEKCFGHWVDFIFQTLFFLVPSQFLSPPQEYQTLLVHLEKNLSSVTCFEDLIGTLRRLLGTSRNPVFQERLVLPTCSWKSKTQQQSSVNGAKCCWSEEQSILTLTLTHCANCSNTNTFCLTHADRWRSSCSMLRITSKLLWVLHCTW